MYNIKRIAVLCLAGIMAYSVWGCTGEDSSDRDSQRETKAEVSGAGKYYFEYDGKKIYIAQNIEEAVGILGDSYEYFEAPSCAADGVDMFYYYQNLTLMAKEIDGKKLVTEIYFKNDTVSTPEGIRINSRYADVVNQYGSDYEMNGSALEYTDGNTLFIIDINDGKAASIEYEYK